MAVTSGACNFLPNYRTVKRGDVIDRPCILLNQAEDVGTAKQYYKCRSQVVGHARLKFELQKTEVEICIVTPLMETCCSKNTPVYLPVRIALEADMCLDTVHFDFKNI